MTFRFVTETDIFGAGERTRYLKEFKKSKEA